MATDSQSSPTLTPQNQEALGEITRLLRVSQGDCSLILAVCNYGFLRERIVEQLCQESGVAISRLSLTEEVNSLHSTIVEEIGDKQPEALFILGLESVTNLDKVLTTTNYIREEFRQFQFPLVFWVTDAILSKFIRLVPDFYSWTTTVTFEIASEELVTFLRETTDKVSNRILNSEDAFLFTANHAHLGLTTSRCWELEQAREELQAQHLTLEPELAASLEFVLGRWTNNQVQARQHYEDSLNLCPETGNQVKKGLIYLHLGLWWRSYAVQQRREYEVACQRARDYFEDAIAIFQQAERQDLVSKFINYWAEVLHRLGQWQDLEEVVTLALPLHETQANQLRQARAYGFLAEIALAKSEPETAQQQARQALALLAEGEKALTATLEQENTAIRLDWERKFHQGWYLFSLAKAQQLLGNTGAARETLLSAKQITEPHYDPALYIGILNSLWEVYFQQGEYLTAFELKQERQTVETQFGFRAFIGAGRLQAKQLVTNPALPTAAAQREMSLEIKASGREEDVKKLVARVGRNDCRLMIIHGQSGVGKSSLIEAGLIPTLQQQTVEARRILPVLQRVYTDWVRELGRCLQQANPEQSKATLPYIPCTNPDNSPGVKTPGSQLKSSKDDCTRVSVHLSELELSAQSLNSGRVLEPIEDDTKCELQPSSPDNLLPPALQADSITAILAQLRSNSDRNLLTVLIFDQFEEFFFVYKEPKQRKIFYEFLRDCLAIPFVTVILSLREDYLYYLLECNNRLVNLDVANNDILNKNILCYLGNFSPADAKLVIQNLTAQTQFSLEPELLDTLVSDLAGDLGEVSPIELQVVGAQLQAEKITKLADYQQLGSKEQLVGRFLDDVVKDCGKGNEQVAKLVLYLLTDENNTRPLKTRADLELELEVKGEILSLVLDILVKSGLVLRVPANPADRYQLVHDYLVTFVRQQQSEKLIKDLEKEREQRRITERQLNEVLKKQLRTTRRITIGFALLATAGIVATTIIGTLSFNKFVVSLAERNYSSFSGAEDNLYRIRTVKYLKLPLWTTNFVKKLSLLSLQNAVYVNQSINYVEDHTNEITDVAFSTNKKYMASSSEDKTVRLWTVDGKNISILKGHTEIVNDVEFSPDSKMIASASNDSTIKIWNIDGTLVNTLRGHQGKVAKIRFSQDGKTIVSLAEDNVVILWNLKNNHFKQLADSDIYNFSFGAPNQKFYIVSTDIKGNKKYWNQEGNLLREELNETEWSQEDTIFVDPPIVSNNQESCFQSNFDLSACIGPSKFLPNLNKKYYIISLISDIKYFKNSEHISRVEFSPNSQKVAALNRLENNIGIWQADGRLIKTIKEYTSDIKFSRHNNNLASVSIGNTINIWSADANQIETIQSDTIINNIEYSVDGEIVVTSTDNRVKIWDRDGSLLKEFAGKTTVKFSPDSQLIAIGNDEEIEIWDRDGSLLKEFAGKTTVKFSPDSQLIAIGNDEEIEIWDRDGSLLKEFAGKTTVKFSPDNQLVAVGDNQQIEIWDRDGILLKEFENVENVTFCPDSQLVAIQKYNQVEIWQYNRQLRKNKTFKEYEIAQISSDGELIVTTDKNGKIKIWNSNGILVRTIKEDTSNVSNTIISPDGNLIAAIINQDNQSIIRIWNKDGILIKKIKDDYSSDISTHVIFSFDSKLIAVVNDNNVVNILSNSGSIIKTIEGYDDNIGFISNSHDFALVNYRSKIKLWSYNGDLLKQFKNYDARINSISFSSNGQLIASASDNGKIQLWQSDGTLLNNFAAHEEKINSINFSPNGKFIVSASNDKTVKLWNIDGALVNIFKGHTAKVNDVKFTPKGNLIVSASDDHTVKLWKPDGVLAKDFKNDNYSVYNPFNISFSPDGKILAFTGYNDSVYRRPNPEKRVAFWLIEGIFEKYVHLTFIPGRDVSFSPDGKAIAVATDKGLSFRTLELDKLLQEGCDRIRDYLKHNPNVKERDRKLCDGIGKKES